MALVNPVDEGQPNFTVMSYVPPQRDFIGSNFSTAGRISLYYQFDRTQVPLAECYPNSNIIHDQTVKRVYDSVWDSTSSHLRILNPIGYKTQEPSRILQDLIVHQAQCDRGIFRVTPTGDKGTNNWIRSTGLGTHFSHINESTNNGIDADWLYTTTPNTEEIFTLYNQAPSNLVNLREVVINLWGLQTVGTDLGMGFQITLYSNGTPHASRNVTIPLGGVGHYVQMRCQGLNLNHAATDLLEIGIKAVRYYVGGGPTPYWRLYNIDCDVFFEGGMGRINETSFDNQHSYFSGNSYYLSGDLYGEEYTFRDACLDILAHAPNLFLYVNYLGQLSCGRIVSLADEATPYEINEDTGLLSVDKLYTHDVRKASELYTKWYSVCAHRGELTALVDPDNLKLNKHWTKTNHKDPKKIHKVVSREHFRDITSMQFFVDLYDSLYASEFAVADITMNHKAFKIEIGDTVVLHRPLLGISSERFVVVEKTFNFDTFEFMLKLYQIEETL